MKKEYRKYYFTVEGHTEQWYLEWLQKSVNADPNAIYTVLIDRPVQKDPVKRVKTLATVGRTEITHIFDYESNDDDHILRFHNTLSRMKESQKLGKNIKYHLGYCNFTFELWVILHCIDCFSPLAHRGQYLAFINRAYAESFSSLDEYKQEDNFKRILNKLTLDNVKNAIYRSRSIMECNYKNGFVMQQYKGYNYYRENPSLSIWEAVNKILVECGLMP